MVFIIGTQVLFLTFTATAGLLPMPIGKHWTTGFFRASGPWGFQNETYHRNAQITKEMKLSQGFAKGCFNTGLKTDPSAKSRIFQQNRSGQAWLDDLLEICRTNKIKVTVFSPPVPESVAAQRVRSDYYKDYTKLILKLVRRYPELNIRMYQPSGYPLDCFADDHHLSHFGAQRMTNDFMNWWERAGLRN